MPRDPFATAFARAAAGVRRALAARRVLDGAAAGGCAGAVVTAALWALGRGPTGAFGAIALLVGTSAALVLAQRARFSDTDVALYLDARLGSDETVSTALELNGDRSRNIATDEVTAEVVDRALSALSADTPRSISPRVLLRRHAALPLSVAALVGLHFLPTRTPHDVPVSALSVTTKKTLGSLDRVEPLRKIEALGTEDRRRLDALADAARRLKEGAEAGMDRRDALDGVAKLKDGVAEAGERLESAKNRAGLDAAVRVLEHHAETSLAARALGDADLVALDRETERLANSTEARSRALARSALEDAEGAARAKGAEDVARALGEQNRLLKKRTAELTALRELSRLLKGAISPEAQRNLERLDRTSAETNDALAEALASALEGLTDAERQRVAERLTKSMEGMQRAESMSTGDVEQLAKALTSKEARDGLRDALKRLANGEGSVSGRRARALALAHVGIEEAARSLTDGASGGDPSQASSPPGAGTSDATSGTTPGGAPSRHEGETPAVAASALPARAAGNPTAFGATVGFAAGTSPPALGPGSAKPGTAALSAVGPREISAVEHSDVPKEYREQVGRYFSP